MNGPTSTPYRTRLAPAPTGALHLGNARTFLITWLRCRSRDGRLVLRMEDLDHPKVKPGAAQQAYEDLRWLGLDWDEGPQAGSRADAPPAQGPDPYVQSERGPLYQEAFRRLQAFGRVYPCSCTRRDIQAAQSAPHANDEMRYPGTCRPAARSGRLPAPDATVRAWRMRVDDERETTFDDRFHGPQRSRVADWSGDFVIAKATPDETGRPLPMASYQLAVVVDDHAMGITEVVRGDDLLASTHRQLVLYEALGWTPPAFLHVPLVVGPDGRRLAKRHGDTRIASLRAAGVPPERVVGWLAHTCGWAAWGEACWPTDVLQRFNLDSLPQEAIVVDARVRAYLGVA